MAKYIETDVRSMIASKQSQIKIVDGREPSLKELAEDKPVMRMVPGKGLMMYVRHNNQRYHVKFSADPKQLGRVRVDDIEPDPSIGTAFIDEDVLPVVPSAKGGTGQDLSGSTGAISISSGTGSAGTLAIANGGTNAADSNGWLNTRVVMTANGVLGYDASAVACTMNTLADANNIRSRVTGTLASGNGLKAGVDIGDAVKRVTIFNGSNRTTIAAGSDDDTPATDLDWVQSDTTYVKKIEFNYVHDPDILSLALFCNLYQSGIGSTPTAYARLVVYAIVAGGTSPIAASTTILESGSALAEVSTTSATYVPLESGKLDVTGLDAGSEDILYRAAIEMKSSESAITAHMTGVAVVAWGA